MLRPKTPAPTMRIGASLNRVQSAIAAVVILVASWVWPFPLLSLTEATFLDLDYFLGDIVYLLAPS